jgi:hypothetical protein
MVRARVRVRIETPKKARGGGERGGLELGLGFRV